MDSHLRSRLRTAILATAVLGVFWIWPSQASATHVGCGDTITQDTTLDSDLLDCPVDGIVIGADNITLDLNGHTIDGPHNRYHVAAGVRNTEGHARVTVKNGTREGFLWGIYLSGADGNQVRALNVNRNNVGIQLERSDNSMVEKNTVFESGHPPVGGIRVLESDQNLIKKNQVSETELGVEIGFGSDDNTVTQNSLYRNWKGLSAWFVGASGNRLEKNRVTGSLGTGIAVLSSGPFGADGNAITHNFVLANAEDGISVAGDGIGALLVEGNHASQNGDDGLDVEDPGTTLTRNTANQNGDLGIEGVQGVIDGGGNRAKGNGDPMQCLNVECK